MIRIKKKGKTQDYGVFIAKLQGKLLEEMVRCENIDKINTIGETLELLENGFWKKLRVQKDTLIEVLEQGNRLRHLIDCKVKEIKYEVNSNDDWLDDL